MNLIVYNFLCYQKVPFLKQVFQGGIIVNILMDIWKTKEHLDGTRIS